MRFAGIADNPPRIFDNQRWTEWFAKRKGQRFECEVRDEGAIHSERQRRYWFGCVVKTFNEVWTRDRKRELPYSKNVVHAVLMETFGPEEAWEERPDGERERPHLPNLSKLQVSRIIDEAKDYLWHEHQVNLPSPEEWGE